MVVADELNTTKLARSNLDHNKCFPIGVEIDCLRRYLHVTLSGTAACFIDKYCLEPPIS